MDYAWEGGEGRSRKNKEAVAGRSSTPVVKLSHQDY